MAEKCRFPEGIVIKPDGVHELDPCMYELVEVHKNVTVKVYRCVVCGTVDISWVPQANSEHIICSSDD